jgi:acylphosphatase
MGTVNKTKRAHVFVSGMVQGVSFRWYAVQEARSLGVGGWIRNLADGRVEAVFEGPEPDVDAMVRWCEHGPRHARVSGVDTRLEEPEGLFEFDVDV